MEIKPGKWRLKDGREVIAITRKGQYDWLLFLINPQAAVVWTVERFEGAEYLGPAVIGDTDVVAFWVHKCGELERQCKELEAETVATRELLEKSEERCEELARHRADLQAALGRLSDSDAHWRQKAEELARQNIDLGADVTSERMRAAELQGRLASSRLRVTESDTRQSSAQCVIEGLEERIRFLEEYLQEKLSGMPEVSDESGVKVYRFKSVTVMVRGEREACCVMVRDFWYTYSGSDTGAGGTYREPAEAWCRLQLEPKWREATEGDVGKACRVKDMKTDEWEPCERLYAVIDHEFRFLAGDPDDPGTIPTLYAFCEVQE